MGRYIDLEYSEQVGLFDWAALMSAHYPELELMFAVPNGGHRDVRVAVKLKRSGTKAGVLDVCLPVAHRGYCSLWIELKADDHTKHPTPEQVEWLQCLNEQGNLALVCYGQNPAIDLIEWYIGITDTEPLRIRTVVDSKSRGHGVYYISGRAGK